MLYPLLVVIHETLISVEDSLRLHADPEYFASYHAVIDRAGNITYLTPSDQKAYAAANSIYTDVFGDQEHIKGSVDDFAYHIALETPRDGYNASKEFHIGYTKEQYESLAWLTAATGVDKSRITTHGEIREPITSEPRCFNYDYFYNIYLTKRGVVGKRLNFGVIDYVG